MHTDAERLYEFEATLRMVDSALDELQVLGLDPDEAGSQGLVLAQEPADPPVSDLTALRLFREVQEGLNSLRHSRAILERTSEEKDLRGGASEPVAAIDALSGLDRALALVDRFEQDPTAGEDRRATLEEIRAEIRRAMGCLHSHDVTEQQLSYASSILLDMDGRLDGLAHMIDPQATARGMWPSLTQ